VARLERGLTWTRWVCEENGCQALELRDKLDAGLAKRWESR
jgi:hypothetical protein